MDTREFIRRALIGLGLVVLALFLWRVSYAILLAFGGVLFAVFLRGLAHIVHRWTRLSIGWSLGVVGAVLLGLVGLAAAMIGPAIAGEFGQLGDTLTRGIEQLRERLESTALGQQLVSMLSQSSEGGRGLLGTAAQVLRGMTDMMLGLVIIFFAGLYFAVNPRLYTEGLVALVPKNRQARAREVVHTVGGALWLWLLGQFVSMVAVGVLTAVGLYIIGVPLALGLGLIAGLLEFVPFLGPIAAAVPVLLVALTVDAQTALYAALLLFAIQQAEGNVITPLVQRWAVTLPPVLVLMAAIAFALLFGILGAIFATPLLVVALVCVKMLYMEDALGERVEVPGEGRRVGSTGKR